VATGDRYDYLWTLGALLIAYAAWVPTPRAGSDHLAVTGMRAVALALIAQVLAIGIQVYAVFHEVGRSERVVTILVLVVASAQIILTRPRAGTITEGAPEGTAAPGDSRAAPSGRRGAPTGDPSPDDR
jgi:hypothetical protein